MTIALFRAACSREGTTAGGAVGRKPRWPLLLTRGGKSRENSHKPQLPQGLGTERPHHCSPESCCLSWFSGQTTLSLQQGSCRRLQVVEEGEKVVVPVPHPATHHPAGLSANSPCSRVIGGGSTRPFAAGARCCSGGGLQAAAGVGGIAWRCRGTSQHSRARASLMPTDPSK